jgi:hypothetical protein
MFLGLTRWQWLGLGCLLLAPLILNGIGMWHEVRRDFLLQALQTGTYLKPSQAPGLLPPDEVNPWLPIGQELFWLVPLGLLIWLLTFITNQELFQKRPLLLRLPITIAIAVCAGWLLAYQSHRISQAWYWAFYPYWQAFGIHRSRIVDYGSIYVIWPLSVTLMLLIFFSYHKVKHPAD